MGGDMEAVYSPADVAALIGRTEDLVRLMLRRGRLPGAFKLSGTWVIPETTVKAYIDTRQRRLFRARRRRRDGV